jgi:hypothetical protein
VPALGQQVDAFLLHPFGDLDKSVETGAQSSLQPVYGALTAGIRMINKHAALLHHLFQMAKTVKCSNTATNK